MLLNWAAFALRTPDIFGLFCLTTVWSVVCLRSSISPASRRWSHCRYQRLLKPSTAFLRLSALRLTARRGPSGVSAALVALARWRNKGGRRFRRWQCLQPFATNLYCCRSDYSPPHHRSRSSRLAFSTDFVVSVFYIFAPPPAFSLGFSSGT